MANSQDQNNKVDIIETSGWGRNIRLITQSAPITKFYPILLIFEIFAWAEGQGLLGSIVGGISVIVSLGIVIFKPDSTLTEGTFLEYVKWIGDQKNPNEVIDAETSRPIFETNKTKTLINGKDKK